MLPIQVNKQAVLRGEIRSTLFEARKVAGSATYKQTEAVLSFRVKFIQFIYFVWTKIINRWKLFLF